MKPILLLLALIFSATGFSQVTHADLKADSTNHQELPHFKLREPVGYTLDKQEFTFTPEIGRIHISKFENEEEIDFGNLRRTTDDGLYIMTSTINDVVSFGRFDSLGNFKTLRYDKARDSVIEDLYLRGEVLDSKPAEDNDGNQK